MSTAERNERAAAMNPYRIQALTDGIFAIAMTLLVLNLDYPRARGDEGTRRLHHFLLSEYQDLFNYAMSFVLLATFWIIHHQQFHFIRRTDRVLLWINILILMAIAVVPYATSLVGDFSHEWAAQTLFNLNMFALGALFYWNWVYATRRRRLVDQDLSPATISAIKRRGLVLPVVALCACAAELLKPEYSSYLYLVVPVILFLPHFDPSGKGDWLQTDDT